MTINWIQNSIAWLTLSIILAHFLCRVFRAWRPEWAKYACGWFMETYMLWIPAYTVLACTNAMERNWWIVGLDLFNLALYPMIKREHENHDDRWKKRRKKVAEKIKALASGKLVAVPVGGR